MPVMPIGQTLGSCITRSENSGSALFNDLTERTTRVYCFSIAEGTVEIGKMLCNWRTVKNIVIATGVALAAFYLVTPPGWLTSCAFAVSIGVVVLVQQILKDNLCEMEKEHPLQAIDSYFPSDPSTFS